jgi:hypothetical protein
MPLSPKQAVVLTPENLRQVADVCRVIDLWLRQNATGVDTCNRIYLAELRLDLPSRKVRYEVATAYKNPTISTEIG